MNDDEIGTELRKFVAQVAEQEVHRILADPSTYVELVRGVLKDPRVFQAVASQLSGRTVRIVIGEGS